MAKQEIRKMIFSGFIMWILVSLLRQVIIFIFGCVSLLPILNIPILKYLHIDFLNNVVNDNLWESYKTRFKIVKRTKVKIIEEVLEKI